MKLYKDGKEVLVDKAQVKILLDAGWSTDLKPDVLEVEPTSEENDEIDEIEEKIQAKPKKPRKPKKISIKE